MDPTLPAQQNAPLCINERSEEGVDLQECDKLQSHVPYPVNAKTSCSFHGVDNEWQEYPAIGEERCTSLNLGNFSNAIDISSGVVTKWHHSSTSERKRSSSYEMLSNNSAPVCIATIVDLSNNSDLEVESERSLPLPSKDCNDLSLSKEKAFQLFPTVGSNCQSPFVFDGGGRKSCDESTTPGSHRYNRVNQEGADCVAIFLNNAQQYGTSTCCSHEKGFVPRPEEQIGPPTAKMGVTTDVPESPLPNNSKSNVADEIGDPEGLHIKISLQSQPTLANAISEARDYEDDTKEGAALEKPMEPNNTAKLCSRKTCWKQFVHRSLRLKSVGRNMKFMGLAVFYTLTVITMATIQSLRGPDEFQRDPPMREDDTYSLLIRVGRAVSNISNTTSGPASPAGGSNMSTTSAPEFSNTTACPDGSDQIFIMSYETFKNGGWVVHVIIGMYTFCAIAAICDIYFVPALEHICEDLDLDPDVAGATFMAAASSAPEFCTSVIGIFIQKNDVGLGAIVGSSIFNLLAIVGLCGVFAGAPVNLSWYPLTRDSIFYTVAVFEMLAFMFDDIIHWYEAVVMVITYGLYILVMVYNKRIEALANSTGGQHLSVRSSLSDLQKKPSSARIEIIRARSHSRCSAYSHDMRASSIRAKTAANAATSETRFSGGHMSSQMSKKSSASTMHHHAILAASHEPNRSIVSIDGTPADPKRISVTEPPVEVAPSSEYVSEPVHEETDIADAIAEYENPLLFPEGCLHRMYWIIVLPITVLHAFTIPDSRIKDSWQSRFYILPFLLSVVYLAIYSYIMVWAMSVAAWALSIPATVTGLTVLAAGTSVPDCLSSIFVARDGFGDMAVSNAIGSNVFDILLCLGLPWLLDGIYEGGHRISSEGMLVAGSTLVITILYLVVSLRLCRWTLTPIYGYMTILFYLAVITFCILVEMNIIFNDMSKHEATCLVPASH